MIEINGKRRCRACRNAYKRRAYRRDHSSAENITITERICRVKAEVTAVPKNGFNSHGQYSHATTDDVYHVLRPLLARHGLDFRVSIVRREMVGYGDGKFRLDYEFSLRFEAVDGQVEDESDTRYLSLPWTLARKRTRRP